MVVGKKDTKIVDIYTDGASSGNPGPGGFGVVLIHKDRKKELSEGYLKTTNNRMELLAVIKGLQALKTECKVNIYSDSTYVVNSLKKGWMKKWEANSWKRKNDIIPNADLWQDLSELLQKHDVEMHWVRGHNGHPLNERCDQLAVQASKGKVLLVDKGFKKL